MKKLNKILVGVDFSPHSDAALIEAVRIGRSIDAEVHVVYADVLHRDTSNEEGNEAAKSGDLRGVLQKRFQSVDGSHADIFSGDRLRFTIVNDLSAAPALLSYAGDEDIDLIVVGTHGRRGFRRVLMGSVAEEVVRRAKRPVLTVREATPGAMASVDRKIVAPIDFSQHSARALRVARELAAGREVPLIVLHVLEEQLHPAFYNTGMFSQYDDQPEVESRVASAMKQFVEKIGGPAVDLRFMIRKGAAAKEIAQVAKDEAPAMIVMGTHGRTGLERWVTGSVSERVIREAPCSVFVVKSFGKQLGSNIEATDEPSAA